MYTGNIFQGMFSKQIEEHSSELNSNSITADEKEMNLSIIGPLLWSPDYFIDDISSSTDDEGDNDIEPQSSERQGSESQHDSTPSDIIDNNQKRKRKTTTHRMTANEVCYELSKPNVSPHLLIAPHIYGDTFGAGQGVKQPFEVRVHPQVGFLSDVHGHLCEAEVIGLLAGKWDAIAKRLYVQASFPCTSTVRQEDDGSTDVELDPVAELAVREIISSLGLIVVGWYHSHPKFRPDPSVTDINNQQQYQNLMRDERTGLEPFVGLIVSTYDTKLLTLESHHQWFHTRIYSDGTRGKKPIPIPMLLNVKIGTFSEENQGIEIFTEHSECEKLIRRLLELGPGSIKDSEGDNKNNVSSSNGDNINDNSSSSSSSSSNMNINDNIGNNDNNSISNNNDYIYRNDLNNTITNNDIHSLDNATSHINSNINNNYKNIVGNTNNARNKTNSYLESKSNLKLKIEKNLINKKGTIEKGITNNKDIINNTINKSTINTTNKNTIKTINTLNTMNKGPINTINKINKGPMNTINRVSTEEPLILKITQRKKYVPEPHKPPGVKKIRAIKSAIALSKNEYTNFNKSYFPSEHPVVVSGNSRYNGYNNGYDVNGGYNGSLGGYNLLENERNHRNEGIRADMREGSRGDVGGDMTGQYLNYDQYNPYAQQSSSYPSSYPSSSYPPSSYPSSYPPSSYPSSSSSASIPDYEYEPSYNAAPTQPTQYNASNNQYPHTSNDQYPSSSNNQYSSTASNQYTREASDQHPSAVNDSYPSRGNDEYRSSSSGPYVSEGNDQYPNATPTQHPSAASDPYPSTVNDPYPVSSSDQYTIEESDQYPSAESHQYSSAGNGVCDQYVDSGSDVNIPFGFRGAGGSRYLGENANSSSSSSSVNSSSEVGVKRKFAMKNNTDDTPTDIHTPHTGPSSGSSSEGRKSGRETKAREIYVPEKDKKISPVSIPTPVVTSVSAVKSAGNVTKSVGKGVKGMIPSVKGAVVDSKGVKGKNGKIVKVPIGSKSVSKGQLKSASVPISAPILDNNKDNKDNKNKASAAKKINKFLVDGSAAGVDKWLTAGAVVIKPAPQARFAPGGTGGGGVKIANSQNIQNVRNSQNRNGPGARGKKTVFTGNLNSKINSLMSSKIGDVISSSSSSGGGGGGGGAVGVKKGKKVVSRKTMLANKRKAIKLGKEGKEGKGAAHCQVIEDGMKNVPGNIPDIPLSGGPTKKRRGGKSELSNVYDYNDVERKLDGQGGIGGDRGQGGIMGTGGGQEEEEREVGVPLLEKLQGSDESSIKGRELITSIIPAFRCLLLGIVSIGYYYSNDPRRVELTSLWKDNIVKSEKLKGSMKIWAGKLGATLLCEEKLCDMTIDFLLSCWAEVDEKNRKNPKKKTKVKLCSHNHFYANESPPNTVIQSNGRIIVYKEDKGEIEPTRKKKRKFLKK